MEEFKCQYCNKLFANKYNLKNHQKRVKYCLEKQKEMNIQVDEDLKSCEYCFIRYDRTKMNRHLLVCKMKMQHEIKTYEEKIQKHSKEIDEKLQKQAEIYNDKIKILEKQLIEKDIKIIKLEGDLKMAKLEGQIDIMKDDHECIKEIAKQSKTTNNTTNKILNLTPLDLSVERIKDVIQNQFDHNYGSGGQKGIAEFTKEKLLTDNDGNLNYVCTDFDRKVFKYKDDTGEVRKDTKAKKLTNKLVKAGLIEKNQNASEQWWVDKEGEVVSEKKNFMTVKMAEINNIENDNSVFVKELSAITVP